MGQYYMPVVIKNEKITVYNREVEPLCEYEMAKLLEHSWWENTMVNAVCKLIHKERGAVYWCGDYSEDKIAEYACRQDGVSLPNPKGFNLEGKYLCNHSKSIYFSCDDWYNYHNEDGWALHPLPILTALGNGLGGGDYHGVNESLVGEWAGDEISVEDDIPAGYEEVSYEFEKGLF